MKLVWDKIPSEGNARNSEGSFIRTDDGTILFAYSRYNTQEKYDGAGCDIALIRSADEGETWSEHQIIVKAAEFGVKNVMSVSALYQKDNSIGFYFLIKENDGSITLGRTVTKDGKTFNTERCEMNAFKSYYVVNNDRIIRLKDGRLVAPAAMHNFKEGGCDPFAVTSFLVSDDDGKSFDLMPARLTASALSALDVGMQEPGIIELDDGTLRVWARTKSGRQYESYSRDGLNSFTAPSPSEFTSPHSPLQMAKNDGVTYCAYNPIPINNYHGKHPYGWGRTPLVLRKSIDDGRTWGKLNVIEDDPERGFCYPAMYFTKDNSMLLAYCRGGKEDGDCLCRLGIMKISLDEIE